MSSSFQPKSWKYTACSHVKTHDSHKTTSQSHSSSHNNGHSQRDELRATSSSSQKDWHSVTNSKGNLVIAKKTISKTSKSAEYLKVEKKIRLVLTEYVAKKRAEQNDVGELTGEIMRICDKYKRGGYGESKSSASAIDSKAKQKLEEKKPKEGARKQQSQPSSKIVDKPTPKRAEKKKVEPEKRGKRISKELMNLFSSDGFVSKTVLLPRNAKRTPKKVNRFSELDFETPRTRSQKHRLPHTSAEKPAQKKTAPVNVFKKPVSVFKVTANPVPLAQNVGQKASGPNAPEMVYQRKVITNTSSTAVSTTVNRINNTTQTTITKTQNFVHNNVRIFHMPMIEDVKQEKVN